VARQAGFTPTQSEVIGSAVQAGGVALTAVSGVAFEAGKTALALAKEVVRPRKSPQELRALIEHASAEVAAARARAEDVSTREALSSMEEALASYMQVLDEPGVDVVRIESAVRELVALARRCEEDAPADAYQALGLKRDASLDEAQRIYRALARIYHADANVAGVDAEKFVELTAAYERVRAYLDAQEAA
jgi:hypothetical protein